MASKVTRRVKAMVTKATTPPVKFSTSFPVMVICRDRLDPLVDLLGWLEAEGMTNIHLVDNDSDYPPLLKFFDLTRHSVIRLGRNVGHTSPWLPELEHLRRGPFIVTDCDVVPDSDAHGAVEHFAGLLNQYRSIAKVGFGLHIDDIPHHYDRREEVMSWESQFWQRRLSDGVFRATLDTTFALYRPGSPYSLGPAIRTGAPFLARHEPWYQDSSAVSEDLAYFRARANASTTWGRADSGETYGVTPQ